MSEEPELRTVFTDSATKITKKAHTDVSMLLTWVTVTDDGKQDFHQAIVPLSSMHLRHDDDKTTFRLDLKRSVLPLPEKIAHLFVCVCDDPQQEWTGDWAHLGAFRVRAILHKCVMKDSGEYVEVVCNRSDCETDIFEVQNCFANASDEYVSLLRSPEYKGKVLPGMFQ